MSNANNSPSQHAGPPGEPEPAVRPATWPVLLVVLAAGVAGFLAWWRIDRVGRQGNQLSEAFEYDLEKVARIDPDQLAWEQVAVLEVPGGDARAIALGPGDTLYAATGSGLVAIDAAGRIAQQIQLDEPPTCLATAGDDHVRPGAVYLGAGRRVEVLDRSGKRIAGWEVPGQRVLLTSMAVAPHDVFVANCAGRVVLRFDPGGKLLGQIARADPERGIPGLVIPSPFLDVALGRDGLLWVVNPGARRLEAYSFDGRLELFWGKGGTGALEEFFGCCNPANIAMLPDGRMVTAEKGLLRVKVYSIHGDLEQVVAGPEQLDRPEEAAVTDPFDHEYKAVDLAVDSRGRIYTLRVGGKLVRVFQQKQSAREPGNAAQQQAQQKQQD